jgi:hypothetical protein
VQLRVAIHNQRHGDDAQFALLALPISVDPRRVYPGADDPGRTRVFVNATPQEAGFVFRPARAVLGVGARRITGAAGFVFAQWDRQGRRVEQGGQWDHRRVDPDLVLADVGRTALLSIDFPTVPPSPESREITLDLSQALRAPQRPPLPLIRFVPVRRKEGYS